MTEPTEPRSLEQRLQELENEVASLREQLTKEVRTERLVIVHKDEERIVAGVREIDDSAEIVLTGDRSIPDQPATIRVFAGTFSHGIPEEDYMGLEWKIKNDIRGSIVQSVNGALELFPGDDEWD